MNSLEKLLPRKWVSDFDSGLRAYPWLADLIRCWKQPPPPLDWKLAGFVLVGGLLLTPLVQALPMLGFDWHRLFYQGVLEQYPPWMAPLFAPFRLVDWRWSLGFVNSLTLVGLAALTARQTPKIRWSGMHAAALVLLTPPLYYLLWDGQIDGLVLYSLVLLPWSIPLVLLRPQILGWVMLSRLRWTAAMAVWLVISIGIWGFWPAVRVPQSIHSIRHPTAMGWATLGWPILIVGLVLLIFSKGSFWRVMAAGMLASPYVQPYHMVLLFPAIGRVTGWKRYILWGWAWIVGIVPGFLGFTHYLALGFPLAVWWLLRDDPHSEMIP